MAGLCLPGRRRKWGGLPAPEGAGAIAGRVSRKLWDDTSPEAERVVLEVYRRMPPARRARQVVELTQAVQQLQQARIRADHPGATEEELRLLFVAAWLPPELAAPVIARLRARAVEG